MNNPKRLYLYILTIALVGLAGVMGFDFSHAKDRESIAPYLILWDMQAKSGDVVLMTSLDDSNIFMLTLPVKQGQYTYRVAIGESKQSIYGAEGKVNGKPIPLTLDDNRKVSLTYNSETHLITSEIGETFVPPRQVVLVGNLQDELGHSGGQFGGEWDPAAETTQMQALGNGLYVFSGNLPAGRYEYKIAIGGSWAENYGQGGTQDGPNIVVTVEREQEVSFYYNDNTHKIADSTWYTMLPDKQLPKIVGDLQTKVGKELILMDRGFTGLYSLTLPLDAGTYTYQITSSAGLKPEGQPVELSLSEKQKVHIFFNMKSEDTFFDDGSIQDETLKHDTYSLLYRSPFEALPTGKDITLRFHARKGDVTEATLIFGKSERFSGETTNEMLEQEYDMTYMETTLQESGEEVDFWEATVSFDDPGLYGYKFRINDFKEYGDDPRAGGTGQAALQGAGHFPLTVYDADFSTPDWIKGAIMYQIFPDRFRNGDPINDTSKTAARGFEPLILRDWETLPGIPGVNDSDIYWNNDFFGGDLEGIRQKLDYLQSLGVTVLYLNPIFSAASNHKYDAANYDEIDPLFGEDDDFQALVEEMKSRGMYLVLDGVFNHVGDDSIYFDRYHKYPWVGAYEYWPRVYDKMNAELLREQDARQEIERELLAEGQRFSPYGWHNWFSIQNDIEEGEYTYQGWSGYDSLPAFREPGAIDVENPAVAHASELNNRPWAEYMLFDENSVARRWIKKGISGWRLDVTEEVDSAFWQAFRQEVKSLTGPSGEEPLVLGETWYDASQFFLGDRFDSVMNYGFRHAVQNLFLLRGDAAAADAVFRSLRQNYPKEAFYALMNLIDSHDTARAIYLLGGGEDTRVIAEKGTHFDYELGKQRLQLALIFQMGYPGAAAIYYGDEAGLFGAQDPDCRRPYPWDSEDLEILEFYRKVAAIRTEHRDLFAYGNLFTLYAEGDVYVYSRVYNREYALIAINRGTDAQEVSLPLNNSLHKDVVLHDRLDPSYLAITSKNVLTLEIPAMKGRMLIGK